MKRTHGRHCPCSACARQDWSEPQLAPCGMHGPSCPPVYDPWDDKEPTGSIYDLSLEGCEFRAHGMDAAWRVKRRLQISLFAAMIEDPEVEVVTREPYFVVQASPKNFAAPRAGE